MTRTPKKLIEVALPLEAINKASAREKSIRHGHPSTLHLWWARRPLAAARAVIFAQMVDDPSAHLDIFPTEKAQEKERKRLFKIIEELVQWENTNNEQVLQAARDEIWASWRRTCAANADHPQAKELFDRFKLPAFHDPFAGGGSLPLEAQRLGMEAYASDLNPVAVLINKAMIEIPPKFASMPPINPESRADDHLIAKEWRGAQGLAEDVSYYGKWVRNKAEQRIGHLYPKVAVTKEMTLDRPDLKTLVGRELTVVAWLWVRTVKSPNPAFADAYVPLSSTFLLSTKPGKEAYVAPAISGSSYSFHVKIGKPKDAERVQSGTKLSGANFRCLLSDSVISADYIRAEAKAGRMGAKMMAVIAEGDGGRVYLSPQPDMEEIAETASPSWKPELTVPTPCHDVDRLPMYGMPTWGDAFSPRQLVALETFAGLVAQAYDQIISDMTFPAGENGDAIESMSDVCSYASSVATYLGLAVGRSANYWSSFTPWAGDFVVQTFARQAIRMVWDHAEVNPFSGSTGNWTSATEWITKVIEVSLSARLEGQALQADAQRQSLSAGKLVSTDPPYYDNVSYADLSDFFYVWLRRSLRFAYSELFATMGVPKAEELVASRYRHGGKKEAEKFFVTGMTQAMREIAVQVHPAFPVTIYYAFKQSETQVDEDTVSTGWETFLEAVIQAGLTISGTWPIRTERDQGLKTGTNVLASSIVLSCRTRPDNMSSVTRREFISALKIELPAALAHLQHSNIAPVDLAQAAIGPGMAIYTRYAQVLDAAGQTLTVRGALALINQILDETLAEQEGDFDPDTRWALAWFEQVGFSEGEYGMAETLSKAKNTSVTGMVEAGILTSSKGKVRLLRPEQLALKWDPTSDTRLTAWEAVHHLVRALEEGGEPATAELAAKLGSRAETARELAYRLYNLCERKKRATEALSYNALVQSWPEIMRLAETAIPRQERLI